MICKIFEGRVLSLGLFISGKKTQTLPTGIYTWSWVNLELLGGWLYGSKMRCERRVGLVPRWTSKNKGGKFVLNSALQLGDKTLERTLTLPMLMAIQTAYPSPVWMILLNVSNKTNYKKPVDPIMHQFVWSGYKIRENYALEWGKW